MTIHGDDAIACSTMKTFFSWLLPVFLSSLAVNAFAADIVCDHARSRSEITICADDHLRQLDASLAAVYVSLLRTQPEQKTAFRQQQKRWLKTRDQCADDRVCLRRRYEERIAAVTAQWRAIVTTKPDEIDRRALLALRSAVEERLKTEREFPLERTLEALQIRRGMAEFSNMVDEQAGDSLSRFPTRRPPGVSADEWRALRKSNIDAGGENGHASYTLLDVDGDGRRDLIVDSYVGGTGLFSYISVLRRQGDRFTGGYVSLVGSSSADPDAAALYSINGRGSNQEAVWIRLEGRVYAAYRNSFHGQDDLFLLRPFGLPGEVPTLTVHYRYTWSVPTDQPAENRERVTLDAATHAALTQALGLLARGEVWRERPEGEPLCPIPAEVDPSLRGEYAGFGPGHYSFETISDVPVWLAQECHLGRVIGWFGRYSTEEGLFAQIQMRRPGASTERSFEVSARRQVHRVESRIGPLVGDMGIGR